jgi:hypothetical protein
MIDRNLAEKDRYDRQLIGNIHAEDRSRAVSSPVRLSTADPLQTLVARNWMLQSSRSQNQRRQPSHELHPGHHQVRGAASSRGLELDSTCRAALS